MPNLYVESLTAQLQRDGLYNQLAQIAGSDAVQSSEDIDSLIMRQKQEGEPYVRKEDNVQADPVQVAGASQRLADVNALHALSKKTKKSQVVDYQRDARILRAAGLGLGEEESHYVNLQMKAIAAARDYVTSIRFFGKIYGTGADYYVYEATLPKFEGGYVDEGVETRGQGTNKFTYFVANDCYTSEVEQLPEVSAAEIVAARTVKKMFTGNLQAPVTCIPEATEELTMAQRPKKAAPVVLVDEAIYLRAQIARIRHSCVLHVDGYYAVDEDEESATVGELIKTEDFGFPDPETLTAQGTWVHTSDYILKNGSTKYADTEDENMPEATRTAIEAQKEDNPEIPMLTTIQQDLEVDEDSGDSQLWKIRQYGCKSSYAYNDTTRNFVVTVVKSLAWPGSYTAVQEEQVCNVYFGNGLKAGKYDSLPIIIPYFGASELKLRPIMTEPESLTEMPEPNPEEPEAASDGGDDDEAVDGQ